MGEVYVITSGKGGVGKTLAAANIGTGLARSGKRVLISDVYCEFKDMEFVMGFDSGTARLAADEDRQDMDSCLEYEIVKDSVSENLNYLKLISCCHDNGQQDTMKELFGFLRKQYDFILVDCPSGLEQSFYHSVRLADKVIVMTEPDVGAVRDAHRIISLLKSAGIRDYKLILNNVKPLLTELGVCLGQDDIVKILAADLLGLIPYEEKVIASVYKGQRIIEDKDSEAGKAYWDIVRRLLGETVAYVL